VAGYRVYWGTSSGSYSQSHGAGINTGSATSYTVTGLTVGRTYYFAVTAYDAVGNESAFSGEASKVAR
jgi:fibronectin type 3 domain-containing protein